MERLGTVLRVSALLLGCGAATAGTCWLALPPLRAVTAGPGPADLPLETLLVALCAVLLLGCAGWLLGLTAVTLAAHAARVIAPGSRTVQAVVDGVDRLSPRVVRRLVTASLGATLTAGVAAPALAGPPPADPAGVAGLAGLRLPDRSLGTALSVAVPRTVALPHPAHASPADHLTLVVAPGDSLWTLAARLVPGAAGQRGVARAWVALEQANARRIGPDPDLILPGTRLVVPDLTPAHRKDAS